MRVVAIRKRALTLVLKHHLLLACDALSVQQKAQLSTPSYKLKKEKKEAKSSTPAKASDTLSPTLVDPALVSVVGVVDGQTTSGLNGPAEKKSKKAESKKSTTSAKPARSDKSVKSSSNRPSTTSTTDQGKSTTSSTDSRISDLDRKWSDRFNRLEALLMAKTLDKPQDPVFSMVKVTPAHAPPANVVRPVFETNLLSRPTLLLTHRLPTLLSTSLLQELHLLPSRSQLPERLLRDD